jgi:hypothetical protein
MDDGSRDKRVMAGSRPDHAARRRRTDSDFLKSRYLAAMKSGVTCSSQDGTCTSLRRRAERMPFTVAARNSEEARERAITEYDVARLGWGQRKRMASAKSKGSTSVVRDASTTRQASFSVINLSPLAASAIA